MFSRAELAACVQIIPHSVNTKKKVTSGWKILQFTTIFCSVNYCTAAIITKKST